MPRIKYRSKLEETYIKHLTELCDEHNRISETLDNAPSKAEPTLLLEDLAALECEIVRVRLCIEEERMATRQRENDAVCRGTPHEI